MNRFKILIYFMILVSITLCIPSMIYLINNKTIDGFDSYYTYTLEKFDNRFIGFVSGIIVIGLLLIFSLIYVWIIKKQNKIFESKKQILIFIAIISFIFMLILPFLSSDIYYYIGDSWLCAKYGENPYYTNVGELQASGINDEILNNTGVWKDTTSVYGPLWNVLATVLVSFSFGNITIALFVFKIASYFVHILNTDIIYRITKSRKYMLLYGLNPLVLIEFLSNVHNDIYLVLFILLALYFLMRKKNIYLTMICLALSISIKYSTALLVPFVLIYCFRDKKVLERIGYCLIFGLAIIAFVVLLYLPYYRDITIFTNMLVQGEKYSQSIMLLLMQTINLNIFSLINFLCIPVFLIIYIAVVCTNLFKVKIKFKDIMKDYNFIMLLFVFMVLTTFQKWYVLWIFPTIIWQSKNMRKFIIYLTIVGIIPSFEYFIVGGDPYIVGMTYSFKMLIFSSLILVIELLINNYVHTKKVKDKELKCQS